MITKELINRINELSRKSKIQELSDEEKSQQLALRAKYLESFKQNFESQLQSIEIIDDDKTKTPN